MKATKFKNIVFWIATTLMCVGMLGSGIAQILNVKEMQALFDNLGYPLYLLPFIGSWKVIGVIVVLLPGMKLAKEWAYAGFFFLMFGALFSHLAHGDEGKAIFGPLFQVIFILSSWYLRPISRKITK